MYRLVAIDWLSQDFTVLGKMSGSIREEFSMPELFAMVRSGSFTATADKSADFDNFTLVALQKRKPCRPFKAQGETSDSQIELSPSSKMADTGEFDDSEFDSDGRSIIDGADQEEELSRQFLLLGLRDDLPPPVVPLGDRADIHDYKRVRYSPFYFGQGQYLQ